MRVEESMRCKKGLPVASGRDRAEPGAVGTPQWNSRTPRASGSGRRSTLQPGLVRSTVGAKPRGVCRDKFWH